MFKTVLKNIWRNRRNNVWLFAELVLVAIVTLSMVDQVAVIVYNDSIPLGYDIDRLCYAEFTVINSGSRKYDQSVEMSNERVLEDALNLTSRLENLPEVESASFLSFFNFPESNAYSSRLMGTETDTLNNVCYFGYNVGQKYFETYGIKSIEGYKPVEELSKLTTGRHNVIISQSAAEFLWPGESAIGKTFVDDVDDPDTMTVVGVVGDVRKGRNSPNRYCIWESQEKNIYMLKTIIRVKNTTTPDDFVDQLLPELNSRFRSGNVVLSRLETYEELCDSSYGNRNYATKKRMQITLLVFFLVNLALGVIGTFMLQTRRRVGEIAVLKVFGANRRHVVSMLMWESLMLTVAGWAVGCVIYLQYALKKGICEQDLTANLNIDNWVADFPLHFSIISLITLAMMCVIVAAGTLLPALKISRTAPVDALRDE